VARLARPSVIAALVLSGCNAAPPPAVVIQAPMGPGAAHPVPNTRPTIHAEQYPRIVPVLSDEELARRTDDFEAAAPGWAILLDPFGMLHRAECTACTKSAPNVHAIAADDRDAVYKLIAANDALLGFDERGKHLDYDLPNLIIALPGTETRIGYDGATVSRRGGTIIAHGHAWPHLAPGRALDPDVLKGKLRARYAGSDVTYDLRPLHYVARNEAGPLELHEAACWQSIADLPSSSGRTIGGLPPHACVDARTGDDLTGLEIAWRVDVKDGKVMRRLFRPGPGEPGGPIAAGDDPKGAASE
jgi:hypothetical protein